MADARSIFSSPTAGADFTSVVEWKELSKNVVKEESGWYLTSDRLYLLRGTIFTFKFNAAQNSEIVCR